MNGSSLSVFTQTFTRTVPSLSSSSNREGRKVTRVEVTLDGVKSWRICTVNHPEKPNKYGKYWCWCFWSLDIDLLHLLFAKYIAVCAWDQSLNTQPEKLTWNVMEMMNNCWFCVRVTTSRRPNGAIILAVEHPTQPGNNPDGWMTRNESHNSSSRIIKKAVFCT